MLLNLHLFMDTEMEQTIELERGHLVIPDLVQRVGHVHSKAIIFFICFFFNLLVNTLTCMCCWSVLLKLVSMTSALQSYLGANSGRLAWTMTEIIGLWIDIL